MGGEKGLTTKREDNKFHVEGKLTVATKDEIKELVGTVVPVLQVRGDCKKILLSPPARCWRQPCCNSPVNNAKYGDPRYLRELGDSVYRIRKYLLDFALMKRTSWFGVFCPDRLISMGERKDDTSGCGRVMGD